MRVLQLDHKVYKGSHDHLPKYQIFAVPEKSRALQSKVEEVVRCDGVVRMDVVVSET